MRRGMGGPSSVFGRNPVRSAVCVVAFALLMPAACTRAGGKAGIDAIAQDYLRLAVSLGERDPDSLDFYVGPESLVAEARRQPAKLAGILEQAASLQGALRRLVPGSQEESERARFLMTQLDAIALRAQLLGGANRPFQEEARTLFGVTLEEDHDGAVRARARAEVAKLLGRSGNPAHAYAEFDARFLVASERIPAVVDEALRRCRSETMRHIQLPVGERVRIEYVAHKPWSAFSRYIGHGQSVIQVNMEFPLTVDRIFDLACHEGYPGHHVFNTMRDQAVAQSLHLEEWLAQPTFSPQSFVSEAAASYAPELAFPFAERLRVEREILFPLAGLDPRRAELYLRVESLVRSLDTAEPGIVQEYLDGRLEFVRAEDTLERETLMEHAETTLLYVNEYRSYMLTYTMGRKAVRELVEDGEASSAERWRRYEGLMTGPVYSLGPR